jgi:integrase
LIDSCRRRGPTRTNRQLEAAALVARPALELADIFRDHGPTWRDANRGHVSLAQLKAMRAAEVVMLHVSDIDSKRVLLRVELGKGGKDRHVTAAA